jgi:hypothetical protein
MFEGLHAQELEQDLEVVPKARPATPASALAPPSAASPADFERWIEQLDLLREMHPRRIEKLARKVRCSFEQIELDPAGYVSAMCCLVNFREEVFLSLGLEDGLCSGGCGCPRSHNQAPCEHTFLFAGYLISELRRPGSPLAARIAGGKSEPRLAQPKQSAVHNTSRLVSEFFAELDRALAVQRQAEPPPDGQPDASEITRLVWQLDPGGDFTLTPLLQRRRKRGDGWTKGRTSRVGAVIHLVAPASAC